MSYTFTEQDAITVDEIKHHIDNLHKGKAPSWTRVSYNRAPDTQRIYPKLKTMSTI